METGHWRRAEAVLIYVIVPALWLEEVMDNTTWIVLIVAVALITGAFLFPRATPHLWQQRPVTLSASTAKATPSPVPGTKLALPNRT